MADSDLTGGLDPARDGALMDPQQLEGFGENHAFWFFADDGQRALLNCHMQADAGAWDVRREAFGVALPRRRLLVDWATGKGTTPRGPASAGWEFACEEPYLRWSGRYRGSPRDASVAELASGVIEEGARTRLELDLDMRMAAPPWEQGKLSGDSPSRSEAMRFMGGERYEQLFRARARLVVDGKARELSGTGLRTHRVGVRSTASLLGHSWCTAVFRSGRAFGLHRFANPEWGTLWSEAFVRESGDLAPARVVASPWLRKLDDTGDPFEILLDTAKGRSAIRGEQVLLSYHMGRGVSRAPRAWTIVHAMAR